MHLKLEGIGLSVRAYAPPSTSSIQRGGARPGRIEEPQWDSPSPSWSLRIGRMVRQAYHPTCDMGGDFDLLGGLAAGRKRGKLSAKFNG